MLPRHVGGRYPTPGLRGEDLSALSGLPLYADHLAQRVHHVHQIALRFHHCVNGLVRHWSFVDYVRILTALDAGRCLHVILDGEAALCFATRHGASGPVATTHEALRIALAAHYVRTRAHAAGNDPHVPFPRTHCSFARDEHVLAIVVLPGHVVVMAAYNFHIGLERRDFSRLAGCGDDVADHQVTVRKRVVLSPVHRANIVLEVLRALRQVREILVWQVDHPLAHIILRQLDEKRAEAVP